MAPCMARPASKPSWHWPCWPCSCTVWPRSGHCKCVACTRRNSAATPRSRQPAGNAGLLAGDAQAAGLARDWLRTGAHLRVAQARVHAEHRPVFVRRDEPAARLSMQRQTLLAENAGHAHGEAATVQRLALSPPGWSAAAQRSQAAAQALQRRMQQVDAPWGRGRWSVDWLGAWADLAPSAPRER